eukprot:SAG31_NODE_289_length_18388_cov_7.110504_6_plen_417_part_00
MKMLCCALQQQGIRKLPIQRTPNYVQHDPAVSKSLRDAHSVMFFPIIRRLPPAPAPAPAPVPAVGPEFLKRLEYIEWIQHQHSDQLTQVLEHIMSDIASEEVVNSHFSHPSVGKSLTDAQQAELDSMVKQTTAVSTVSLDKSLVETAFTGQNFVKLCFDGWRLQVGRKSKKDSSEDEQAEAADAAIEVRLPAQEQHISEETAATIAEHCQDKVSRKMREHLEFEELKNEVKKLQSSLNGLREQAEAAMSAAASAQQLAENTGKPAVATTGGLSPEQAQQIEEQAAAVEVKLQQHEEKIYATAEELKAVVAEADRARQVEETHAEDITWLKKELSDVRTELKPVGNDARAAAAGVTALNSKVESMSVQNDKLQVRVEKTADGETKKLCMAVQLFVHPEARRTQFASPIWFGSMPSSL